MLDGGFLWSGQDTDETKETDETRDMEDNSKGDGKIPPSNCSWKLKSNKY